MTRTFLGVVQVIRITSMADWIWNESKANRLSDLMRKQVASDLMKGGHLRIRKEGELLYDECFGYADAEEKRPIAKDTIYRMYSMTKPVTAVALMIAVEEGLVKLEDPVATYLEGFADQQVYTENGLIPVKRPSTLYDLLTMTAGLVYPDQWNKPEREMCKVFDRFYEKMRAGENVSTVEMCNAIGRNPLLYQPGEAWYYSAGADVIAAVVEVASGKKYSSFLEEKLFGPLQMSDTAFWVPAEKRERFAQVYIRDEKGALNPLTWEHLGIYNRYQNPPSFEIGGAGLVSTMEDYEHFARMLALEGINPLTGERIVSAEAIRFLATNHLTKDQRKTFNWDSCEGYGYGGLMRVLEDPEKAVAGRIGEFGWDGWTGNYFYVDPVEKITFLYMIQTACTNGPKPLQELKKVLYEAEGVER